MPGLCPLRVLRLIQLLATSGHKYGLTITLPSSYWYMKGFHVASIEPIVDWFNVMTYALQGTWESTDAAIDMMSDAFFPTQKWLTRTM